MKNLFVFALLLFLIHLCSSKYLKETQAIIAFNKEPWKYLTKFAFAPGIGKFRAKFQFTKPINRTDITSVPLKLLAFKDDSWETVLKTQECESRLKFAIFEMNVDLPFSGKWSKELIMDIVEKDEVHTWFFAISDCEKQMKKAPSVGGNRIRWELAIHNSDGSHFSEEENNFLPDLGFLLTLTTGLLLAYITKFIRFSKSEESIDYPTLILTIAVFLEFLSIVFEMIHLYVYSFDGKGYFLLNFGNQALSVLSQFLVTALLLLVAYGWSIYFIQFEDIDVAIPIGILVAILEIVIVGLGRITDNAHYRYHDYENWAGIVLIVIRVLINFFWFYLYSNTIKKAHKEEQEFYRKFAIFSVIYLEAFPVMVILSSFGIAPHNRHKFMTVGTTLIQIISLGVLMYIFTSKKTKYYTISLKGKMLLPSNKLH